MKYKRALVTGSSRGIGRAIALRLAKDGYEIVVHCSENTEIAKAVANEITEKGGRATVVSANLCDTEQTKKLCEIAKNVDILILNASIQIKKKWEDITLDDCEKQLTCNYISSLMLIQAAVPNMREKKWGRIVAIGSVQETKPHPDMLVYSSSKSAQTNMIKSLALQVAKDGITVNSVAPGAICTDRNKKAIADKAYKKQVCDSIPLGYIGMPEDCAGMVSLLCSADGKYITGQSIYVDGGKSL